MPSRASPAAALSAACAAAGLDPTDAEVLHDRANTVYKLAGRPLVARLRKWRQGRVEEVLDGGRQISASENIGELFR